MKVSMWPIVCTAMFVALVCSRDASAHRLDEYLQATRVEVEPDRISIEIDLTPGATIAGAVLGWIDTNRDGAISTSEGDAYVRDVLRDVSLDVDATRTSLTVVGREFPSWEAVRLGTGSIRVRAVASVQSLSSGRHRVAIVNAHHAADSVYLANALVPTDHRIRIAEQRRDQLQRTLTIEYDVAGAWTRAGWLASAVIMLGFVVFTRRRVTKNAMPDAGM
jgi:hypothetical protein